MSAGKVAIGAFRTYPKDHVPTGHQSQYQSIPMDKIEDFGVHCKQYYELETTTFKSPLDSHLLELLWDKYWINTLSSSPTINASCWVPTQTNFYLYAFCDCVRRTDNTL